MSDGPWKHSVALEVQRRTQRWVREIVALPGRVEGGVVEIAAVVSGRDGRLMRAFGYPPHGERFAAAGFDLSDASPGIPVDGRDRSESTGFLHTTKFGGSRLQIVIPASPDCTWW